MTFSGIFPYGRSFGEYCLMFSLTTEYRGKRLLGVGDGPSSFNSEAKSAGWDVISVDPVYGFSADIIKSRCEAVVDRMISSVASSPNHWIWLHFSNKEELRRHRRHVLDLFLADFATSRHANRYVAGALPRLPFRNSMFDLAVCSHVLFSWTGLLNIDFHIQAIHEMLRVAHEVRVFPLRNLDLTIAHHVESVMEKLSDEGCLIETRLMGSAPGIAGTEQLIIRNSD